MTALEAATHLMGLHGLPRTENEFVLVLMQAHILGALEQSKRDTAVLTQECVALMRKQAG